MSVRQNQNAISMERMAQVAADPNIDSMATTDVDPQSLSSTMSSNNPLRRKIHVAVRATLSDLITQPHSVASWTPTEAQLGSMLKQRRFVSLNGTSQMQGNLKSVIVHKVSANMVRSTFPIAVGASITGVDESYFSSIGKPFSMIATKGTHVGNVELQKDDVTVAYEFAQRYPVRTHASRRIPSLSPCYRLCTTTPF